MTSSKESFFPPESQQILQQESCISQRDGKRNGGENENYRSRLASNEAKQVGALAVLGASLNGVALCALGLENLGAVLDVASLYRIRTSTLSKKAPLSTLTWQAATIHGRWANLFPL
jgi:hypothetical protein